MAIQLPELPYDLGALAPHISKKTMEFHYGKHHRAYVDKTNELIAGTPFDRLADEEILFATHKKEKKIFNQAAQAWNHTFYWRGMTPEKVELSSELEKTFAKYFNSTDEFKKSFIEAGEHRFGSGWVWLVKDRKGTLKIRALSNAGNPMLDGDLPLLCCDVWEHAYYLDYQNERPDYLGHFWELVNWDFVSSNLERSPDKPKGAIRPAAEIMDHWNPRRDLPAQGLT